MTFLIPDNLHFIGIIATNIFPPVTRGDLLSPSACHVCDFRNNALVTESEFAGSTDMLCFV